MRVNLQRQNYGRIWNEEIKPLIKAHIEAMWWEYYRQWLYDRIIRKNDIV